jgi:hypothetical protein
MRGEIIGVWSETWREIWSKLAKHKAAPDDLFCELYRELTVSFENQPDVTKLADIIDNPDQAKDAFRKTPVSAFRGELPLLEFFERSHVIMVDLAGDPLANEYFLLIEQFLEKYSLRYDLRRPFSLHPTLPGVFSRLVRELRAYTARDAALHALMMEFEDAVRDLGKTPTSGKIKTCIQKQVNLLEAIGKNCPGVQANTNTLGRMCDEVGTWPHDKIKMAMKNLYGFASDYPGIRHGGTQANALRDIEMRDLVSVCILLAGFSPYLTDQINSDIVYRGS